ncbi:uncharacterized protein [Branchiostoma lanceolatum]|uniref:uncharacterized protein n=1 Tax=Branchiostoma lanceolatum TaxID=7740 RepID=UPI0034516B6E
MLTKEQKARLLSLWGRGLMTTNRSCLYISALAEEAAEVGVSWHQTASFVKGQRVKTGLNRLDPEDAGLLVTAVQALGDLRARRGTSLEAILEDIMGIMGKLPTSFVELLHLAVLLLYLCYVLPKVFNVFNV